MLRLLVGPAGSGKTGAMIREITAGGAERPRRRMLIVPEQYSHRTERALCEAGGPELSLYAEVFSFTGLARRVFSEAGGVSSGYLDDGGRLLVMYSALQKVRQGLNVYGRAAGNPEFIRSLIASVDEMKTCGVTAGELTRLSEQVDFSGKLSELAAVMKKYPQVLVNVKASQQVKDFLPENRPVQELIAECEAQLGSRGRVLVRPSGTEPLIRVMLEGEDLEEITGMAQRIAEKIEESL